MPVVSNTSPLLNLAIIGRLDLLAQQFRQIIIPVAVRDELRIDDDLPGSSLIRDALESGWIRVEPVQNAPLVRILAEELDQGEAEAIALGIQCGIC